MLIKKVKNTIAVVAKVVQSLTNNSETDVPSVKAVKDAITTTIVTGQEYETGRVIDGKKEYGKRINCGTLPNTSEKNVAHGLSGITFTKLEGVADNGYQRFPLPFPNTTLETQITIYINGANLVLKTGNNRSTFTAYVTLCYTKN